MATASNSATRGHLDHLDLAEPRLPNAGQASFEPRPNESSPIMDPLEHGDPEVLVSLKDKGEGVACQAEIQMDDMANCTQTTLHSFLVYLQAWITRWQFLIMLPILLVEFFTLDGPLFQYYEQFCVIVIPLNFGFLWVAVILFPLGADFPGVPWASFFPTFCFLVAVGLDRGFDILYGDQEGILPVIAGSFVWMVFIAAIKKIRVLREKVLGNKKRRCLWVWLALVSLLAVEWPVKCIIVTAFPLPVYFTATGTSFAGRVFKRLAEAEQERLHGMEEEREARLERQYAALGGRTTPAKKMSTSRGQRLFPIIFGILVVWYLWFISFVIPLSRVVERDPQITEVTPLTLTASAQR